MSVRSLASAGADVLCIETMGQTIAELPWLPVGVTYAAIPIGSAITLLFVIEHLVFGVQSKRPIVIYEVPVAEAGNTREGVR